MDQEKLLQLQMQMRNNNEDYKNFLDDMDSWSNEIKSKENEINLSDTKKVLPQIRNASNYKEPKIKQPKIKAYDYQAWDKFDVDKALEECDKEEKQILDYSNRLKEEGNTFFKNGDYLSAISKYTEALSYDANNDILFTNRAMCYLKLGEFESGENDCTQAIVINSKSVKSFYRRAKCRKFLNKLEESLNDYKIVLKLEPDNKSANKEMKELQMELNTKGIVEPLFQPMKNRISTNRLKRIEIIDVNPNKSFNQNNLQIETSCETMEFRENEKLELSENSCQSIEKSIININENENIDKLELRIPKTSVQLTKDLSNFRRNSRCLATYVIGINCWSYNNLIGHALDSELLLDLVNGLSWAVKLDLLSPDKFVESFNHLHKVSRFSSSWLMISDEEKIHFNDVIRILDRDLLNKLNIINFIN